MRNNRFVALVVLALVVLFASACDKGGGPVSPDPTQPTPAGTGIAPPAGGNYTWVVPAGRVSVGSTSVPLPAGCIKVELVSTNPGVGGTIPGIMFTGYVKVRLEVCADAPMPSDGKGYKVSLGLEDDNWNFLTSYAGASHGPVKPGENKSFEIRPIVTSPLPARMPWFGAQLFSESGGGVGDPTGHIALRERFWIDWRY